MAEWLETLEGARRLTLSDIIFLIGAIWVLAFIFRCFFAEMITADGFEFVNPKYLYEGGNLNWFGACFIALIWNILFLPFAIIYWIYKLCTVGKKYGDR